MSRNQLVIFGLSVGVALLTVWCHRALDEPQYFQGIHLDIWARQLECTDLAARREAAEALRRMGTHAKSATGALTTALGDSDACVRCDAAMALSKIGTDSVPTLLAALNNKNAVTRRSAAGALAHVRPVPTAVVQALIASLDDSDVGWQAGQSLSVVGSPALTALIEAVRHPSARVRALAIESLGDLRGDTNAAISCVSEALHDPDEQVRAAAARALPFLGMCVEPESR